MACDKARTYEIYLEIIRSRLDPLPGVMEFTSRCRQLGLKLAVATSAAWIRIDSRPIPRARRMP